MYVNTSLSVCQPVRKYDSMKHEMAHSCKKLDFARNETFLSLKTTFPENGNTPSLNFTSVYFNKATYTP